jgi:PAS domain S-box-containing protein
LNPHRVSRLILTIVALFVAILVAVQGTALRQERDAALARAEAATRNLARVADQYTQRVFETSNLVAAQVAGRIAEFGDVDTLRDNPEAHRWLRRLSDQSAGDYVMIVDREGRPVALSAAERVPATSLADRRWFRAHLEGADSHLGEAIHSRITNEILFTFSRRLVDAEGRFAGAVQVSMRGGFFQQGDLRAETGDRTVIGLFDLEGRVLARTGLVPDRIGTQLPDPAFAPLFRGPPQGSLSAVSPFDGLERIVSFRRLPDWPVVVTASVPVADVLAPWHASMRRSVAVLGSLSLALLLLSVVAIRMVRAEAVARGALAEANDRLRDAAARLEERVAERTAALSAARDALAEREVRLRALFDSTFQFIGLLSPDGVVLDANQTFLAFGGLRREDVVGRPFWDASWWDMGEETQSRLRAAILAAAAGEPQRYEVPVRGAGGRVATIDFSLKPMRDAEGNVALLVPEGHDLTELKAAEARLREAQKLEALGQLTGGVAHDFNNLLMAVLGNLALLRKRMPDEPRLHRLLDGALQGAERGAALTQRLLAFARRQELRPAAVELRALVTNLRALLERSAGPTVDIRLALPEGLPPAMVDANQLELALLNLVVNARDAMPQGGRVEIAATTGDAPSPAAPAGLTPGAYLRLSVRDSGGGMDQHTLARATEPFFTTKGVGKGSGLGLSMVQGLAQQSGGALALSSSPGQGTVAEMWLPRADSAVVEVKGEARLTIPARARPCTVLVVDDDPLVLAGTAMMLEDIGHRAIAAASAMEALEKIAAEPSIDLVVTDYAMPGVNGLELAERLRQERPALPLVLASGYADLPAANAAWPLRLAKPYRQEDLAEMVDRVTRAKAA